jgi:hypothetical protein
MAREPSGLEKGVRFGCGVLFGLVLGVIVAFQFPLDTAVGWFVVLAVLGLVCGFLAAKYGDEFWHSLTDWFAGWWWW